MKYKRVKVCKSCGEEKTISNFGVKDKELYKTNKYKGSYDTCLKCYYHNKPKQILFPVNKKIEKKLNKTGKILKRFSRDNKKKATKGEMMMYDALKRNKILFTSQYPIFDTHHRYIVDAFIPVEFGAKGIVLEVDGEYHKSEELILKDRNRDDYMHLRGFKVIRITNNEVKDRINDIISLIMSHHPKLDVEKNDALDCDHVIRLD